MSETETKRPLGRISYEDAITRIHNIVGNSIAYGEQMHKPPEDQLLRNRREFLAAVQSLCNRAIFGTDDTLRPQPPGV